MPMHLLESTPRPKRGRAGAILSLGAHAALISLAVVATARAGDGALAPKIPATTLIFTATPPVTSTSSSGPSAGGSTTVIERGPIVGPIPNFTTSNISVGPLPGTEIHERFGFPGAGRDSGAAAATSGDGPRTAHEVDKPAAMLPATTPRYPESLRSAGIEGRVSAHFVVDTAGHVELATLVITSSTHPLFTSAVRATLPSLRFIAAESNGRRVRQLVELPFDFTMRTHD